MKFYPCKEEREGFVSLGEGYYFTADDEQYILYRIGRRNKIDRKTRKELDELIDVEETLGYYQTLQCLIKDCVAHEIRQNISSGMAKNLHDVIERLDSFEKYIERITKGY